MVQPESKRKTYFTRYSAATMTGKERTGGTVSPSVVSEMGAVFLIMFYNIKGYFTCDCIT